MQRAKVEPPSRKKPLLQDTCWSGESNQGPSLGERGSDPPRTHRGARGPAAR